MSRLNLKTTYDGFRAETDEQRCPGVVIDAKASPPMRPCERRITAKGNGFCGAHGKASHRPIQYALRAALHPGWEERVKRVAYESPDMPDPPGAVPTPKRARAPQPEPPPAPEPRKPREQGRLYSPEEARERLMKGLKR